MAKNRYFKLKGLPLVRQIAIMRQYFPRFKCVWKINTASWTGTIQPTAVSEKYEVRIQYEYGSVPKVWVTRPALKRRTLSERIPHVYPGNRLCLYLPGTGQWSRHKAVAETIVPWTSLWLYHYEIWHATGEWLGGGVHGDPKLEAEEVE
jgi:hypothetical protein